MRAVNLIPAEQRRGGISLAGRSGGAAYVVVGLILGLAVMAVLYGKADHEIGAKQAEATRLSAEAQQASSQASGLAPYTSFVAMREERLKAVQELANTRFDWAHAMHELGRVVPTKAALSTVDGTIGSVTAATSSTATAATSASKSVSSATPAGSTPNFTVTGCATSQSAVALTMNRLRLIDGVSEVSLQSSSKSGSSGGGGGCPAGDPAFSVQVSFDALPAPTVKAPPAPAASSTSNSAGGGSKSGAKVNVR